MAGFLYFKPNHSGPRVTLEKVNEWGLGYAFEQEPGCRDCMLPAASCKGSVFGVESELDGKSIGVYPEEQTWAKVPNSDCWVGYFNEHKPTEKDLRRESQLAHFYLQLENGERWHVPKVVHVNEGEIEKNLPCKLDVDDEGKIRRGDPVEKYQYLWELATPYIDAFLVPNVGDEFDLDDSDILADAVKFLQVNYRIGLREAIMLELFTEDLGQVSAVCLCAIDFATWVEWRESLKKTNDQGEPDGSNTLDGKADSAPATSPLPQTS